MHSRTTSRLPSTTWLMLASSSATRFCSSMDMQLLRWSWWGTKGANRSADRSARARQGQATPSYPACRAEVQYLGQGGFVASQAALQTLVVHRIARAGTV